MIDRLVSLGPGVATLIASLLMAVTLLAVRVAVLQRMQSRRQRENRQETERLKSLVAAYRALAGSFSPATTGEQRAQVEQALADLVLFGSVRQIALAADCVDALKRGAPLPTEALVLDLRADLRQQLGLDPIPASIRLPSAGPGGPSRGAGPRDGATRAGGGGGGGGTGVGEGALIGAGGVGLGAAGGGRDADDDAAAGAR